MTDSRVLSRRGLLAAVGGGLAMGVSGVLESGVVRPAIDLTMAQPPGEWWTYKRDPARTGYQPEPGPRAGLEAQWQRRVGSANLLRPGLVSTGGRVLAAGRYATRALSTADGAPEWEVRQRDRFPSAFPGESPFEFVQAGPTVSGDRLFLVSDVTLYQRRVADGAHGWAFRTNSSFERILPVGNVVFAGVLLGNGSRLVALDQATGTQHWSRRTDEVPLALAPEAGLLVTGTSRGGSRGPLVARDPMDGSVVWRTENRRPFDGFRTPAVAGGRVYAGGPELAAFDAADGDLVWTSRPTGVGDPVTPATDGDRVYLADGETATALDAATGEEVWSRTVGETSPWAPPIVAGETLYVATRGEIVGLRVDDGTDRFRHGLSNTDRPADALVSADGRLYARTGETLRAFGGVSGGDG